MVLSILEVPSGYMSDTLGRKLTLCIAAAFKVLAFTIYGLATNFSLCCVAEVLQQCGCDLLPCGAQHSTAQHSTAQHSTAQHSTAQHNTTQHSLFCAVVWCAVLLCCALCCAVL